MSRKVWLVRRRFAVRNRLRLPRRSCISSPATHTPGSTRTSVRFSRTRRIGPGRIFTLPVGACSLLNTTVRFWRSRVASPWTSRNCVECVTGSNRMQNCAGRCSDRIAFSPGARSTVSITIFSSSRSYVSSAGRSTPELQKICRKYSEKGSVSGSCASMRRTRGLVTRCAQRAGVFVMAHAFERGIRVQHAAAAGAEHVPRQLEQPESRAMKKCADGALLVDTVACREVQHIDATELAVRRPLDVLLDGGGSNRVGRLPEDLEQRLCFAHRPSLPQRGAVLTGAPALTGRLPCDQMAANARTHSATRSGPR